jgi:hypothetical protein
MSGDALTRTAKRKDTNRLFVRDPVRGLVYFTTCLISAAATARLYRCHAANVFGKQE